MASISTALGGLQQAQGSLEQVARRVAGASGEGTRDAADSVDLSAEMVKLLQAKQDFHACTNVIRTADQMEKTALDLLG